MATGGSGLLGDNDDASDKLLWRISSCVDPGKLQRFANETLEISDIDFKNIVVDLQDVENRKFRTLKKWYDSNPYVKVGHLVERLVAWQQDGYLSRSVWSKIDDIVKPEVIQEVFHLVVPAPSSDRQQRYPPIPISEVQKKLRISLRRRCKNYLSTDWLPTDKAQYFPIRDYFVGLEQRKKVRKARKQTAVELKRIHDILDIEVEEGGVSIAIRGAAGIGKSSSLAILASDWVEGKTDSKLKEFDFVFLVELKNVKDNSTLEQIVIEQHKLEEIPEAQIRSYLLGGSGKPLLLLDGYDEYKKWTYTDIDNAIEYNVRECFLVVTSREGDHMSKETLAKIDGEIEITGFSQENIKIYAEKFLEDKDLVKKFLEGCEKSRISGFLRVPILLLITLVLFDENKEDLPTSLTEIVSKIAFLMVDRGTKKHFGSKSWEELGLEVLLKRFGELCLDALKTRSYFLQKEDIVEISPVLLKLGLVHGEFLERASLKGQPEKMSFPHRMFQEFWAAYHAQKYIHLTCREEEIVEISPVLLKLGLVHGEFLEEASLKGLPEKMSLPHRMFQEFWAVYHAQKYIHVTYRKEGMPFNMADISMRGVMVFVYGLATEKDDVFRLIYSQWLFSPNHLQYYRPLLKSLTDDEPSAKINPLCNNVICSMNDYKPHSSFRSWLYTFDERLPFNWKDPTNSAKSLDIENIPTMIAYNDTDGCLYELLRSFALHGITLEKVISYGKATIPGRSQPTSEDTLKLKFSDETEIHVQRHNFKWASMKLIERSIENKDRYLRFQLIDCWNVPSSLFTALGKVKQLISLYVNGGTYDCKLGKELCKLLDTQRNVQAVSISEEPGRMDKPLTTKEKVEIFQSAIGSQLEALIFYKTTLSGVLARTAASLSIARVSLARLVFNFAQLTEGDVLGLEKMIQENQLPALQELYLQGNEFSSCKHALERLLGTIDEKLENCKVIIRPQDMDRTNRSFKCLRIQLEPPVIKTALYSFMVQINP